MATPVLALRETVFSRTPIDLPKPAEPTHAQLSIGARGRFGGWRLYGLFTNSVADRSCKMASHRYIQRPAERIENHLFSDTGLTA